VREGVIVGRCGRCPAGRPSGVVEPTPADEDGLSVAVLCTAFCAASGCTESETASAPATVVLRDRFAPEWLRVMARPGGSCVLIANRSGVRYDALYGTVEADGVSQLCFGAPGVYRVRPGVRPYSGGFYVGAAEP